MEWKKGNYIGLILFVSAMFFSEDIWFSPIIGIIGIILMFNNNFIKKEN